MKVRNYLESITGVGIYPIITLLIFFIFFTVLALWVLKSKKQHYNTISNLPLENGDTAEQNPIS